MNFEDLILTRQSDRKYDTKAVEQEKLMKCIEAARLAPSATNSQPWKFIAVLDPSIKKEIADCAVSMGMNKFCETVPVIVVLVMDKPNFMSKIGSVIKDKEFSLLDVGIAANQFCLQAAELGLGTCIVGWFNEKKAKKVLQIPSSKRLPLLITLGYPASETRKKIRKNLDDMFSIDKW